MPSAAPPPPQVEDPARRAELMEQLTGLVVEGRRLVCGPLDPAPEAPATAAPNPPFSPASTQHSVLSPSPPLPIIVHIPARGRVRFGPTASPSCGRRKSPPRQVPRLSLPFIACLRSGFCGIFFLRPPPQS